MIKLLAYTDGTPAAHNTLHFAAELRKRLNAHLAILTWRSQTHAVEEPPPVGVEFPLSERARLPRGLQNLLGALDFFVEQGVLERPVTITIRDVPHGYIFVCKTPSGGRLPFYECFGPFIEALNREVNQHRYDLLIITPPRRGRFRFMGGDTTRKLALDLETSLLVVRGGGPDSPYVVCADGSASSRRQFPLLKAILPAIRQSVDVMCVLTPGAADEAIRAARECLQHARNWLTACGKMGVAETCQGDSRAATIIQRAGSDSVIVMGASLRHDVYRRMLGSLPMRVLTLAEASVLLVKSPPEADDEFLKRPFACGNDTDREPSDD
jgi:nucleotide-binding universal stress UspA family protein